MLEKNAYQCRRKEAMTEEHARLLCNKLEKGGITLPDSSIAFQGKK